jgi:hypothetical protein
VGSRRDYWFDGNGRAVPIFEVDYDRNGRARRWVGRGRDGSLEFEGNMPNGTGSWRLYNARQVMAGGRCTNGKRDGEWWLRDQRGEVVELQSYKQGVLDGRLRTEHHQGDVRDGKPVGSWRVTVDPRCVRYGKPGSQCGFVGCSVHSARFTLTATYDETGVLKSVSDVEPPPRDEETTIVQGDNVSAYLASRSGTCDGIESWTDHSRLPEPARPRDPRGLGP